MNRVAFHTLGCKLNFSESSTIARQFETKGYKIVPASDAADIYVVNTCSVTENADKKCRKIVRDIQRIQPAAFIAVIGCYAQLKPKEISEIPGVDTVLGASDKFKLLDHFPVFEKQQRTKVFARDVTEAYHYQPSFSIGDRTRTFLKVQDGCNYNCAFCTIPLARGKSRSSSIASVIGQATEISKTDVNEIVLTGVNTGDFGIQNGRRTERFIDLLVEMEKSIDIPRIRISSIEPNLLHNDIIQLVAESSKFVPHFHIPLQSGSDLILEKMHRRYRTDLYRSRIETIKQKMPHAGIGVDVITGFPGETAKEFELTYDFIHSLDVTYLHVFPYSARANTPAVNYEAQVGEQEKSKRAKRLRALSAKKKHFFYQSQLGSTLPVLFEDAMENGRIFGYTPNYIRVGVKGDESLVNTIRAVRLQQFHNDGTIEGILSSEMATF